MCTNRVEKDRQKRAYSSTRTDGRLLVFVLRSNAVAPTMPVNSTAVTMNPITVRGICPALMKM